MHGGLSAPSPMSVTRSAAEPSPLMADVQGEDMDAGWPVHSATSSPAGLQGCSFGGEEDDLVGNDEVEGDGGDIDGQNSDNAQEDRDSATVGQRDGAENVPLGFEKALWEAMEWKLNRPSIKCDKTLASENLPGNAGGNSTSGGPAQPPLGRSASDGKATEDSDQAAKTRRANTGKTRMDNTISGGPALGRVMEDATRSYGEGLDKAAATLAKATSEAGSAIAAKIGDVADAMRGGNTVLEMLVGVLVRRGGGGNSVVDRKEVVVQETRLEWGTGRHRNMDWGPIVINEHTHVYYSLVNGLLAMRMVAGLGYERDGSLAEVVLFVKRLSNVVPDSWLGPCPDVVGDIVRYLVSAIAEEHVGTSSNNACYVAHMEPPLRERGYLHGAVQFWCSEDDLRAACSRW
ncbi:hypothetical protein CBR_g44911 [Chara braunii]|uniref:Uncharacterized protein n=1 Tax=Chara braunii TaxID=69332 RepID=A0A388LXZ2_CHABU|nr:hypothetical protein CBR_g44911 [Chara braunii]|eukprot:GBG87176.1 hypothetical protein CBR_g44911 [Chara braunii]